MMWFWRRGLPKWKAGIEERAQGESTA
jgi:hypothetical protein